MDKKDERKQPLGIFVDGEIITDAIGMERMFGRKKCENCDD